MSTTFAGLAIGVLILTVFTSYAVGLAYPDPCAALNSRGSASCTSPWNDLSSVGIQVMPTNNGGFSSVTNSADPSNIQQTQAVATSCGAAGIGSGAAGALVGTLVEPGLGTVIGGALGYFGFGTAICSFFQSHPQSALSSNNFLSTNPVLGTFGDVSAIFGIILMYFNALIHFAVDFIGYDSALSALEPIAAFILIPIQIINGLILGIWVIKSIIPGGGS
jgi:hypothetical protein